MVVIAVSGEAASGKTTIARKLAEIYGLRFISIGMLFRKIAEERGISVIELHKIAEQDESIDRTIDNMAIEEAKKGNVVIEGHLTAWILKDIADVKIYLKADLNLRAKRLAERDGKSFEEALREIQEREEINRRRYLKIYGIDIRDLSIFDIVLDRTYLNIDQTIEILKKFIDYVLEWKKLGKYP